MSYKVYLTFNEGCWKGQEIPYDRKECVSIGRGNECSLTLPKTYSGVSHHHCLLDINPPLVTVRDLGSLNGTYLNGKKIGQRSSSGSGEEAKGFIMRHGDRLGLGSKCEIVLKVEK